MLHQRMAQWQHGQGCHLCMFAQSLAASVALSSVFPAWHLLCVITSCTMQLNATQTTRITSANPGAKLPRMRVFCTVISNNTANKIFFLRRKNMSLSISHTECPLPSSWRFVSELEVPSGSKEQELAITNTFHRLVQVDFRRGKNRRTIACSCIRSQSCLHIGSENLHLNLL